MTGQRQRSSRFNAQQPAGVNEATVSRPRRRRRRRLTARRDVRWRGLECLEPRMLLTDVPMQITTPDPIHQAVDNGAAFSFDVDYTTANPQDETLTGLGLRMHWDSSKVTFTSLTNVLGTNLLQQSAPQADTSDFDNDPSTDQFVLVAWFSIGGSWPGNGTEPAQLYTANFTSQVDTGFASVNFSTSSVAQGRTFRGQSATIVDTDPDEPLQIFQSPSAASFDEVGDIVAALGDNQVLVAVPNAANGAGEVQLFDATTGGIVRTFAHPDPASHAGGSPLGFGSSVSAMGTDQVLIGAENADVGGVNDAGEAYLIDVATGDIARTFSNPTPSVDGGFGIQTAVLGNDLIAIAADLADPGGVTNAGIVYVYNKTTGALVQTINNPTPGAGDQFGLSMVAVGTDKLLIGAPQGEVDNPLAAVGPGKAYLFNASTGAMLQTFVNPSPTTGDFFGLGLGAVGTSKVVIGAPGDSTAAAQAGAAYLYDIATGSLIRTFTDSMAQADANLGGSLTVLGTDRIALSAVGLTADLGGNGIPGQVLVFDGSTGNLVQRFEGPGPADSNFFGIGLATLGTDQIIIGAPGDATRGTEAGAAFLFDVMTVSFAAPQPMAVIGQVSGLKNQSKTVVLPQAFEHPVVFVQPPTLKQADPAVVRITNIQSDRFTIHIQEADGEDGTHATSEVVNFIVLEEGLWELADGTLLEVGLLSTNRSTGRGVGVDFEIVDFLTDFTSAPTVVTQVQTNNDAAFVKTRQRSVSATGFQVTLEPAEGNNVKHGYEQVGYVAMEAGTGTWSGHLFESASTANNITSNFRTINFTQAFSTAPRFVGGMSTQNGFDAAEVRYLSLGAASVKIKIEEDHSLDGEVGHGNETVSYLAIEGTGILEATRRGEMMGELGTVTGLTHVPVVVRLLHQYEHPVVFAQPISNNGGNPAVARITDVQTDRFTVYVDESEEQDGIHNVTENLSYIVLEQGVWDLGDGLRLEVGTLNTGRSSGRLLGVDFEVVSFQTPFTAAPALLTQVQSNNDTSFVKTRQRNISATGFQVTLEQEEAASSAHGAETIGYVAITEGTGPADSTRLFEAHNTTNQYTHNFSDVNFTQTFTATPKFLASLATYSGSDSSQLRYEGFSLDTTHARVKVEEDASLDAEQFHGAAEGISYVAIQGTGLLSARRLADFMGETGQITGLTHVPVVVMLHRQYDSPVVFAQPIANNGGNPSVVRITDIQSDRFTMFVDESEEQDGIHNVGEIVSYVVLEEGQWELADGTHLEVNRVTTPRTSGRLLGVNYEVVSFNAPFVSAPAMITQVQTFNDTSFVKTRQRKISATGFQVTMEQEEAATMAHGQETIGYLAIDQTTGTWGSHLFESTTTAELFTDKFRNLLFTQTFTAAPNFIGSLSSYHGLDSAEMRYEGFSLDATRVRVRVEEDTSFDGEQFHSTAESVGFLALQGSGLLVANEYIPDMAPPSPAPGSPAPASPAPGTAGTSAPASDASASNDLAALTAAWLATQSVTTNTAMATNAREITLNDVHYRWLDGVDSVDSP